MIPLLWLPVATAAPDWGDTCYEVELRLPWDDTESVALVAADLVLTPSGATHQAMAAPSNGGPTVARLSETGEPGRVSTTLNLRCASPGLQSVDAASAAQLDWTATRAPGPVAAAARPCTHTERVRIELDHVDPWLIRQVEPCVCSVSTPTRRPPASTDLLAFADLPGAACDPPGSTVMPNPGHARVLRSLTRRDLGPDRTDHHSRHWYLLETECTTPRPAL